MIDHIWSVLCLEFILDRDSNLLSLINILEELHIQGRPSKNKHLPIPIGLASMWVRSNPSKPVKGEARFSFVSPNDEVLEQILMPIDLTKHERLRSRGNFLSIKLPKGGRYSFLVEYKVDDDENWKKAARIPLNIVFHIKTHQRPQPKDNEEA